MSAVAHSSSPVRGPEALERAFGRLPDSTSEGLGWNEVRVCTWSVEVPEYELPALPELLVALHTAGHGVDRGCRERWSDRRSFPGRGTIRPPGESDHYRVNGGFGCVTLHVPMARVEALADALGSPRAPDRLRCQFAVEDSLLSGVLNVLAAEVENPRERGSLLAEHLVDSLILHLLRRDDGAPDGARTGRLSARALRRVEERIEVGLADPLTIDELAEEAGLSPFHFCRAFRRTTGKTPHGYVTARRIERAKTLLLETSRPLVDVAVESGFASQQHFTDVFRRQVGAPPGRWRRAHRP